MCWCDFLFIRVMVSYFVQLSLKFISWHLDSSRRGLIGCFPFQGGSPLAAIYLKCTGDILLVYASYQAWLSLIFFCLGGFNSKTPKPPATDPETYLHIQLASRRRSQHTPRRRTALYAFTCPRIHARNSVCASLNLSGFLAVGNVGSTFTICGRSDWEHPVRRELLRVVV